jgi:hypothetical protein
VQYDIELSGLVTTGTTDSDSWPGGRIFTVQHDDGLIGHVPVITGSNSLDSSPDSMWGVVDDDDDESLSSSSKTKNSVDEIISSSLSSILVAGVIGNSE